MDLLSIVIIGKNEERVLEKTFNSVFVACDVFNKKYKQNPPIVYVDSRSIDKSVEIAEKYDVPVKILKGKCTAGLARNEGAKGMKSKYIFFLDGDTEVDKNWLVLAVSFLQNNKHIVGVGGQLKYFIHNDDNKIVWKDNSYWKINKKTNDIFDGVGGTFMYKMSVFNEVKGFNDYSISEEFDLMLRVLARGYEVNRINHTMAIHNDFKSMNSNRIIETLMSSNLLIPGAVCRNVPKNQKVWYVILRRYWLTLLHPFILLFILYSFFIEKLYIIGISFMLLLFLLHLSYKKNSFKRALLSIVTMIFYSLGFYIGFIKKNNQCQTIHPQSEK